MFKNLSVALALTLFAIGSLSIHAQDWPRFRGPMGNGVASDSSSIPAEWSPKANIDWKVEMPGPGAPSPIIIDGKVFVTCYSGYGLTQEEPGDIENLMRHLVCVDLKSGDKLWQVDLKATQPEDPFSGAGVPAHGYASHTPVSDGKNVYAFFGKSGVYAFDMDGNQLWHAEVGNESDPAKWGSSSSPVIHEDTVIITAAAESQSIIGLDKQTGEELWRQEAKGLDNMWGTPTLVEIDDERTDLVMCVAKEMWGLDPESGKLRWYADGGAEHAYASVVVDNNRVYAFTGRGGGSIAIDAGGKGNVSEDKTVWTGRDNAGFGSPIRHNDKLYVISRNIVTAVDANSGKRLQRIRLKGTDQTGGRFGSLDYASPIIVGDYMYYLNGSGQMFVFDLSGDELKMVSVNRVTSDKEIFWGTPAVGGNQLVLRSQKYLYCVTDKGEQVNPEDNLASEVEATEAPEDETEGGGRRGGGRRFDPMTIFTRLDTNSDEKITADELEGNQMADRLKELDKDENGEISKDEFQSGIGSLMQRGGRGRGGNRGGESEATKPDRPQRPESAEDN